MESGVSRSYDRLDDVLASTSGSRSSSSVATEARQWGHRQL